VNEEKATSFGTVAGSYDRVRPGPAPAALDWLVPAGCEVAVDLAAGTGLFTRALLGRAARVVAVEPDPRMREVLARRSPGLDVREGRGEAMPLPDASRPGGRPRPVQGPAAEPGRNRAGHRDAAALVVLAGRSLVTWCRAGGRPDDRYCQVQVITKTHH
jgi:SAM-dependent methyltransferase